MRGYPQFSFWISIALVKIYISCIIINLSKNTFELVGTVLKTAMEILRKYKWRKGEDSPGWVYFHWFCTSVFPNSNLTSLQCRRFWWSIEWFAAILDSLQTGRIGARMTLGKLFTSPHSPLYQDGGLNSRWKYISTRPTKIRLHCRL